jgi:hypothetical protein
MYEIDTNDKTLRYIEARVQWMRKEKVSY